MKNWLTRENFGYRLQQLFILLAHLLLLKWMFFTLSESGVLSMEKVLLHFTGMGLYGAALIRGTAFWARRHHLKNGGQIS
jgi:hypothetical protein